MPLTAAQIASILDKPLPTSSCSSDGTKHKAQPLQRQHNRSVNINMLQVAEDCAGLGSGICTLRRVAHKLNEKGTRDGRSTGASGAPSPRTQYQCLRGAKLLEKRLPRKRLKIKPVYMSENNEPLRKFLKKKYPHTKIIEDSKDGMDDKGDKLLGTDGQLDVYIAGNQCQPFSKMGKNGGRKDERSDTSRNSVAFIVKRRPKVFIMEQVKNIVSKPHRRWLRTRIIKVLKNIKNINRKDKNNKKCIMKKLYKVRAKIVDSAVFGSNQSRKRLYIVGVRRDCQHLQHFRMPTKGHGRHKALTSVLRGTNLSPQVPDYELNHTELRNWIAVRDELLRLGTSVGYPIIADFHQSSVFGTSWQSRKSPTVTKTRAGSRAFWIVNRNGDGFEKRKLDLTDYATLQGWEKNRKPSTWAFVGFGWRNCREGQ